MTSDQRPAAPYIDTRQVGEATITVISEGELFWPPRFAVPEEKWRAVVPEADEMGRVWVGLNTVLVRLGEALVVIDPGLDDPGSAWERDLARVWPDWPVRRTAGLRVALEALGIAPDEVTHVIITHPHGDHYAGICFERDGEIHPRFPHARHFMGRADWEGNPHRHQSGTALERLELIDRLGMLELLDGDREVAPGVTILAAPGETPGHLIVRIESEGEIIYNLGDLMHLSCEVEHADWMPPQADVELLRASRERIFADVTRENALLVTAHETFPPWGRIIVVEGTGHRWQRDGRP